MEMKILMINKFYFIKGGSERYYFELTKILQANKHTVIPFSMKHPDNMISPYESFFVDNIEFNISSVWQKLKQSLKIIGRILYSWHARHRLDALLRKTKPDIAHLHMIDHQISPSILHSLKRYHIPVIMTTHQSKIICPNYRLFNWHSKTICEKCLDGHYYHPILERCHKNSRIAGLLIAFETYLHKAMKIYEKNVDILHTPSIFFEKKFIEANIRGPDIRQLHYTIRVNEYKPYFFNENYFSYFGRLEEAKGLETLLRAMKNIPDSHLYIIGKGYYRNALENYASELQLDNVKFTGAKYGKELQDIIGKSKFIVIPSECYDNSPLVVYEAYALGKPVIGARIGGIPELIDHHQTGLLFKAGDSDELFRCIRFLIEHPKLILKYGKQARKKAEMEFSPEVHYPQIIKMYEELVTKYSQI
jgi:glycosyltransferase involved in cell wall biosynthesis